MIYVTAVRLSGVERHSNIVEVRWRCPYGGGTGTSTTAEIVDRSRRGVAVEASAAHTESRVAVVRTSDKSHHVRAHRGWLDR